MQNTSLRRRIAAMLYDALLVLPFLGLATIPFIAARGGNPVEPGDNIVYQLVLALVIYGFFVGFWWRSGRTLGMQSWRLQLESMHGQRPTFAAASGRFFAAILSWLPCGLGFWWQLWDKDQLTWHDRISRTRVVYCPKKPS